MYEGDEPVMDYEVFEDEGTPDATVLKQYTLGLAEYDEALADAFYHHANHLGTLALRSNGSATITSQPVYTAFGEMVGSNGELAPDPASATRYGYVGAHGYETLNDGASAFDMTYLHVGARYYSPSLGRFLQRDPIGLAGGINVYAYVGSSPSGRVDPDGLIGLGGGGDSHIYPVPGYHTPLPPPPTPTKPLQPEEELEALERRMNYWAASYAGCAAGTVWVPPVSAVFGIGSAAFWAAGTYVSGL
jgi:RHS repeat-associated protein